MDNQAFEEHNRDRKLQRSVRIASDTSEGFPLHRIPALLRWRKKSRDTSEPVSEEILNCGASPPAEDIIHFNESFEFEEYSTISSDLTVQICHDTIRSNILDHLKSKSGRQQILSDIESRTITADNLNSTFYSASNPEINISFLWSAFTRRWDLLEGLLELGAQLHYFEPSQGLGALHLSAFSGCVPSTKYLLSKGANPNAAFKCYTPLHAAAFGDSPETASILLQSGAQVQALAVNPNNCNESVLHCAVRANAVACVRLFVAEGADVNQDEYLGMSPVHLAADLGHHVCLKILLELKGINVNVKTREKQLTPLHVAAEAGNLECIEALLEKGADANARNSRGQTPLHLAARDQSYDCVKVLLRKGNSDPNIKDYDKRTPLHAAVGKATRSYDVVEILIAWEADVNSKDQYDYTPLHIAAMNELSQCVEVLIYHGADVTATSKFGTTALGLVSRKTPASITMIHQKLDSAITLHHHASSNREAELRLDFRSILQNCYPKEISFLNTFVDEGQKEILLHPLCSAFLHLKWEKIRKYYIARMLLYFIFVITLSIYVLTALAHNCYNHARNITEKNTELCGNSSSMGRIFEHNPFLIELMWYILATITVCEIFRKLYGLAGYPSMHQYLSHPDNIIEWAVIASVFVISFVYSQRTFSWQNHVGAFAVLCGWINMMLMVGQLPVFGSYVAMYTKVQGEFAKLLLAYSCLMIGFTISFCVIFPDTQQFENPFIGLITVLVWMAGEVSQDLLLPSQDKQSFLLEASAQITFVLFLLFVTIILMNLLVGIAVHDIQGLQKTAGLSKLVMQTKLIYYMECTLFNKYVPKYILNILYLTALVSPKAYRVVLNVKPLNPREKRLPRDILKEAHEVAKQRKSHSHTLSGDRKDDSKRFTNSYYEQPSEVGSYTYGLGILRAKVEKGNDQVEELSVQVRELQKTVEQLVTALANKDVDSNC